MAKEENVSKCKFLLNIIAKLGNKFKIQNCFIQFFWPKLSIVVEKKCKFDQNCEKK